jgi:hypothetical protein
MAWQDWLLPNCYAKAARAGYGTDARKYIYAECDQFCKSRRDPGTGKLLYTGGICEESSVNALTGCSCDCTCTGTGGVKLYEDKEFIL